LILLLAALLTLFIRLGASTAVGRRYAYSLAYPGCTGIHRAPADFGISDYQEVKFVAEASAEATHHGLRHTAWWVPSENGAAVILIPGIGQARDGLLDEGTMLARHGYGVLMIDARSCTDPDVPFTSGYAEVSDVAGALAFVQAQAEVDADRVGVLGYSAGGAVAIISAAQLEEIQAVVAKGNFYNLGYDIANKGGDNLLAEAFLYQVILGFYRYYTGVDARKISPIDAIGHISPRPVLLIFGEHEVEDGHAYQQFAAAGEPKSLWIVPGVGHGGYIQTWPQEYEAWVTRFFDEALLQ
jgi:dipeptidyl aminopeptidase/acylaminoacyl peptidase